MTADWTRREVSTRGGRFVLEETGGGSPVVYLHDEIAAAPGPLVARLAARHRVLAPTHPGFAQAERPSWVHTIRDVADSYLDLFQAMDLGPEPVVVGASMGAWIGAEISMRLTRIGGLVLLNPVGMHVPGHPAADFWYVRDRDELLFNELAAMPQVSPEEQVANEESAARYGWSPRLFDPALAPRLHRLAAVPVLLVWGTDDRILPPEHLSRWHELLPHAAVSEIQGAGHFPGYERPEETAAAIEAFLDRLPEPAGAAR